MTDDQKDEEDGEAWYDSEIAPVLRALAERCHKRGIPPWEVCLDCPNGGFYA